MQMQYIVYARRPKSSYVLYMYRYSMFLVVDRKVIYMPRHTAFPSSSDTRVINDLMQYIAGIDTRRIYIIHTRIALMLQLQWVLSLAINIFILLYFCYSILIPSRVTVRRINSTSLLFWIYRHTQHSTFYWKIYQYLFFWKWTHNDSIVRVGMYARKIAN